MKPRKILHHVQPLHLVASSQHGPILSSINKKTHGRSSNHYNTSIMLKTTVVTKFTDSIKILLLLLVVWVATINNHILFDVYRNQTHTDYNMMMKIRSAHGVVGSSPQSPMDTDTTTLSKVNSHSMIVETTTMTNNTNVLHKNDIILPPDPILLEPILSAGIMYTICGPDRSGNVIADLLYAHAFAFGYNITYGGSCCLRPIYPTMTTKQLLQALGWDVLFPFHCPNGVDSIQYRHLRIDGPDIVQSISPLLLHKDTYRIDGDQSYLTPAWRQHVESILNAQRMNQIVTTSSTTPTMSMYEIAVHVRRGDVSPCTHARRYLPNSHYLALIDQYTTVPPRNHDHRKVHVTIYSESDTFEPLDVFMERNYTLELDTADLGQIWKALATADVVILSRSTFSIVPAILNPNIVVATEFMNFDPHQVRDGEFDVHMMDGWHQADPALVHASDQIIHDMVQTQC